MSERLTPLLPDPTPEERAAAASTARMVWAAVGRLAPRYERVIRLRFTEDLTLKEVGAKMGITGNRVRQMEVKALARIRQHLTHNRIVGSCFPPNG